ncbi:hypothetical protein CLV98_10978 [Dyadobacter jejuensis]|uniref:Uncharacterized protein n=1 Tax=Dyadobacter jejuensis TaxID=1082580 RepID=A0A316AIA1_9BACT|nr:hypothetical protein [Dyadobacter jejuensis]PWJ56969.1 hypothetical protein CLV98_10978 [Dyadobacter jejuensis]
MKRKKIWDVDHVHLEAAEVKTEPFLDVEVMEPVEQVDAIR